MWQYLEMVLTVTPGGEGCSDIWWVEASLRNLTFSAPRSNLHNIRISILRVFEEQILDIFEYIQWWKAPCFTRPPILLLGSSTGNHFLVLGWNLSSGSGAEDRMDSFPFMGSLQSAPLWFLAVPTYIPLRSHDLPLWVLLCQMSG